MDLAEASRIARRALAQNSRRISKFGDTTEVLDFSVPVTYNLVGPENKSSELVLGIDISAENIDTETMPPFGRENDILHIETALLMSKQPLLLTGEAGIGKSFLLSHLQSWWKQTGFIEGSVTVDFAKENFGTESDLYNTLEASFQHHPQYSNYGGIVEYLHSRRNLIFLDSLESMTLVPNTIRRKQRINFKKAITTLQAGRSLFILASRSPESWLSEVVVTYSLLGLHIMSGLHLISWHIERMPLLMHNTSSLGGNPPRLPLENQEDKSFFEHLLKLVDRNPSATQLLVYDFLLGSSESPKDYFLSLLRGDPLMLPWQDFWESDQFRGLYDIQQVLQEILHMYPVFGVFPYFLAPAWKTCRTGHFLKLFFTWCIEYSSIVGEPSEEVKAVGQELLMHGTSGDSNVSQYLREIGTKVSEMQQTPGEQVSNEDSYSTPFLSLCGGISFDNPFAAVFTLLWDNIVDKLKGSLFLQVIPSWEGSMEMLRIHPLLTIALRSDFLYTSEFLHLKDTVPKAFSLVSAANTISWPWVKIWNDPSWDAPKAEVNMEFYNLCSTIEIALQSQTKPMTINSLFYLFSIGNILIAMPRGSLKDVSRIPLICLFMERVLLLVLQLLEDFDQSAETTICVGDDGTALFLTRQLAMTMSWRLLELQGRRVNQEKVQELLKGISRLLEALRTTNVEGEFVKQMKSMMLRFVPSAVNFIQTIHDDAPLDPEVFWNKRQRYITEFIKLSAREFGTSVPIDQALAPFQLGYKELLADKDARKASMNPLEATTLSALDEVDDLVDSGQLSEARKIVDIALLTELNYGGNDNANKAALFKARSLIDEKEGKWKDALHHAQVAYDLEVAVAGETEKLEADFQITQKRIEDAQKGYVARALQFAPQLLFYTPALWSSASRRLLVLYYLQSTLRKLLWRRSHNKYYLLFSYILSALITFSVARYILPHLPV